ncbi:unnamed protein product [Ranitomeya imitator]|uniref:Uncharacterized protein n=1 Tax=Ranitomeya imitator TaxID=111125 RepID=A0ABN9LYN8_9NEOB|nr:unnamed protein product [Ranitomeya imitator]
MLYKLKTSKVFEKLKPGEGKQTAEIVEDDPFAIQMMSWCPESRILCVAGVSAYVIIYRFSKHEVVTEIASLEVRLQYEVEDIMTPDPDSISPFPEPTSQLLSSKSRNLAGSANTVTTEGPLKDSTPCLRPLLMHPMILFALAAAAWHWLLQDIVPVYQIKGISKLFKLCLPKVQCFCDSLTSPPSERQKNVYSLIPGSYCWRASSTGQAAPYTLHVMPHRPSRTVHPARDACHDPNGRGSQKDKHKNKTSSRVMEPELTAILNLNTQLAVAGERAYDDS